MLFVLALKSLSDTKFLQKMMRPLNTALWRCMTKGGYYHLCLWVYPKDRSCSLTPGDRKKSFLQYVCGSIRSKDWHCSHYFNHIDQPLHVCQCGGKRSPHFKAPQYNHRNHRKPKEMTQRLDRVYLEDRITIVY